MCKLSGLFLLYTSICNSTQREREGEDKETERERESFKYSRTHETKMDIFLSYD